MTVSDFARLAQSCAAVGLLAALAGCFSSTGPQWIQTLYPQLECGMSVEEVRALSSRAWKVVEYPRGFADTHCINDRMGSICLTLEEGGLVSARRTRVDGLTSERTSPLENLCTGELAFRIHVAWTVGFEGASVFVDGERVAQDASSGIVIELSRGTHEVRIEKEGVGVATRTLVLDRESAGQQYIDLSVR